MEADDQPGSATERYQGGCANSEPIPATISAGEPSPGELQPGGMIPVFEAAIKRRSASFEQLATATFLSREKFNRKSDRKIYERYIIPLTEAFEAAHGPIISSFYCDEVVAAAVLTERQKLVLVDPSLTPGIVPIAELLFECDHLNREADRVLAGPKRSKRSEDLQNTKMLIYWAAVKLLSRLNDPEQPPPRSVLDLHRREVRSAHDYYRRAASRHAQFDYFIGMLIGGTVSSGLAVLASLCLIKIGMPYVTQFTLDRYWEGVISVGCLIAGAVGAVVSVMSRMTFGSLALDDEAGRRILMMLGAFRPVIGMVLGAVMWVLTGSGVLSVVPTDPIQLRFFRVLTAFLAGFSERWAQDMLGQTANQIAGPRRHPEGQRDGVERALPGSNQE